MQAKKVKITMTATREYFLTELYPDLTEEQRTTLNLTDVQTDFDNSDEEFFNPHLLLEDSEATLDLKVEEVNE